MAARDARDRVSTCRVDLMGEKVHLRHSERRGQAFCGSEGAWTHISVARTLQTSFPSVYFLEVGKIFVDLFLSLSPPPRLPVFARPALTTFITLIILSEIAHPSSAFAAWIFLFALHILPLPPSVVSLLCTSLTLLRCRI